MALPRCDGNRLYNRTGCPITSLSRKAQKKRLRVNVSRQAGRMRTLGGPWVGSCSLRNSVSSFKSTRKKWIEVLKLFLSNNLFVGFVFLSFLLLAWFYIIVDKCAFERVRLRGNRRRKKPGNQFPAHRFFPKQFLQNLLPTGTACVWLTAHEPNSLHM